MKRVLSIVAASLVACSAGTTQEAKTASDRAAFMERTRCAGGEDEALLAPVLNGNAVRDARPLYSNVDSAKGGLHAELRGATLVVDALPGMTAEWLDRALECHSAQNVLGRRPVAPDDPFWLPESTVDIDVRSAKDGFDVAVSGFSTADAQRIWARADAFWKARKGDAGVSR
jgi:hypothetical protein